MKNLFKNQRASLQKPIYQYLMIRIISTQAKGRDGSAVCRGSRADGGQAGGGVGQRSGRQAAAHGRGGHQLETGNTVHREVTEYILYNRGGRSAAVVPLKNFRAEGGGHTVSGSYFWFIQFDSCFILFLRLTWTVSKYKKIELCFVLLSLPYPFSTFRVCPRPISVLRIQPAFFLRRIPNFFYLLFSYVFCPVSWKNQFSL